MSMSIKVPGIVWIGLAVGAYVLLSKSNEQPITAPGHPSEPEPVVKPPRPVLSRLKRQLDTSEQAAVSKARAKQPTPNYLVAVWWAYTVEGTGYYVILAEAQLLHILDGAGSNGAAIMPLPPQKAWAYWVPNAGAARYLGEL